MTLPAGPATSITRTLPRSLGVGRIQATDAAGRVTRFIFGEPAPAVMPDRVRHAIEAQQYNAEILIGLAQVAAIALFGTLYALSPRAYMLDVPFQPVPLVLSIYAVVVGMRLWLAVRDRLSAITLGVSLVVDIAVLMGLIWSFHLQYEQPPSFYLKAPTLFYVFIIIALRALRFEPIWILFAGGTAAVGWFGMLAYALYHSTGQIQAWVTRDYIEYITSSRILVGAEIDKIIAIVVVTMVLYVAVVRARNLMINAVAAADARHELARFIDPRLADRIALSETPLVAGEAEVREVAVVMFDLRGFTRISKTLSPVELLRLLGEYQGIVVPIVRRYGGYIDKFMGDGIMLTLGSIYPSETYAADALALVDEVMAAIEDWRADRRAAGLVDPEIGAAVTHGNCLIGALGHDERLEFSVIGDPVNLAAKLEKHNKVEGTRALALASTYRLACDQGYCATRELRETCRVDGFPEPLSLAVLKP